MTEAATLRGRGVSWDRGFAEARVPQKCRAGGPAHLERALVPVWVDMFSCGAGWVDMFSCGTGWVDVFSCGAGWVDVFSCGAGWVDMFSCGAGLGSLVQLWRGIGLPPNVSIHV